MASGVTVTNTMADNDYDSAMDKAIEKALITAGAILERQAALLAPVDTGRLRGSITWATKTKGSEALSMMGESMQGDEVRPPTKKWVVHVGTNVEYAPFIEYGTRNALKIFGRKSIFKGRRRRMQPFLRPALMAYKEDFKRDFAKWVEVFLKRGK